MYVQFLVQDLFVWEKKKLEREVSCEWEIALTIFINYGLAVKLEETDRETTPRNIHTYYIITTTITMPYLYKLMGKKKRNTKISCTEA